MNQFSAAYLTISVLFAIFGAVSFDFASEPGRFLLVRILVALLGSVKFVISGLLLFLALVPISRLHTPETAFFHFVVNILSYIGGRIYYRRISEATKTLRATQNAVLKKVLKLNANTELGKELNLAKIGDRYQFQAALPLTTFVDYELFIAKIANGEENVMTAEKVVKLSITTGTTGKPKMIPFVEPTLKESILEMVLPLYYATMRQKPLTCSLAPLKQLEVKYEFSWTYAECGLPIGIVSGLPKTPSFMFLPQATPAEGFAVMSDPAQTYIHLLFALMDDNLRWTVSVFAGPVLVAFEFLRKNWQQLAYDIRYGRVSNTHNIPPDILANLRHYKMLGPNPKRADQIEAECLKGFQGIGKRLWHNIEYSWGIVTGAHEIYADRLKYYLGPGVTLISPFYASSEGLCAIALTRDQFSSATYTLQPRTNFYEFIPESDIFDKSPRVFFADELQVGQQYEIVVTNRNGFYRYRMGDVIRVVGFFNQAPVIDFRTRVGGILDLCGEKTNEDMISVALKGAVIKWKGCQQLIEYTATESITLQRALLSEECHDFELFYVIFVELSGVSRALTEMEIEAFDESLCTVHEGYHIKRVDKIVARPKIFVVQSGTFTELRNRILRKNNNVSNQYKVPRYLKTPELLTFLVDCSYKKS